MKSNQKPIKKGLGKNKHQIESKNYYHHLYILFKLISISFKMIQVLKKDFSKSNINLKIII